MVIISFMLKKDDAALEHIKNKFKLDKAFINPFIKRRSYKDRLVYLITAEDYVMPRLSFIMVLIMLMGFVMSWLFGSSIGPVFNTLLIIISSILVLVLLFETIARTTVFSYNIIKMSFIKNGYKGEIKQLKAIEGINALINNIKPKFKSEV